MRFPFCPPNRIKILIIALFYVLWLPHAGVGEDSIDKVSSFEELESLISQTTLHIKENPRDLDGRTRLARLLYSTGRNTEAEATIHETLKIDPDHTGSLFLLADLYWRMYRFQEAQDVLNRIKTNSPDEPKMLLFEARIAIDRMDFRKAENLYRNILDKSSESTIALCGLAEISYWENSYEEAEDFIRLCLKSEPDNARAFLIQSKIHRIRQENDKWAELGRKAVDISPFNDEARANLANILYRGEGKLDEGYEQARIALRINPYCHIAHVYLGNGWTPKDYKDQLLIGDEKTVEWASDLLQKGDEALLNRNFSEAENAFSQVLDVFPHNITAQIGKGSCDYLRERYNSALVWFFKVLDVDFDYGLAHYGVAQSLLRLKDRENILLAGIEKEFDTIEDVAESAYLRDVFINYAQLDQDLQKIIRLSIQPLRLYLEPLKNKGATFSIMPFHKLLWESPTLDRMKGRRTFDKRLWDDIKGLGGFNATSGWDWERDVKFFRFNVVAHEFAHQVHRFLPQDIQKEITLLYEKAKKERLTLDFYADFNEMEYFAVGVEAYVSEKKLPDQKIAYGHTRKELLEKDPDLYRLIESLSKKDDAPSDSKNKQRDKHFQIDKALFHQTSWILF